MVVSSPPIMVRMNTSCSRRPLAAALSSPPGSARDTNAADAIGRHPHQRVLRTVPPDGSPASSVAPAIS